MTTMLRLNSGKEANFDQTGIFLLIIYRDYKKIIYIYIFKMTRKRHAFRLPPNLGMSAIL